MRWSCHSYSSFCATSSHCGGRLRIRLLGHLDRAEAVVVQVRRGRAGVAEDAPVAEREVRLALVALDHERLARPVAEDEPVVAVEHLDADAGRRGGDLRDRRAEPERPAAAVSGGGGDSRRERRAPPATVRRRGARRVIASARGSLPEQGARAPAALSAESRSSGSLPLYTAGPPGNTGSCRARSAFRAGSRTCSSASRAGSPLHVTEPHLRSLHRLSVTVIFQPAFGTGFAEVSACGHPHRKRARRRAVAAVLDRERDRGGPAHERLRRRRVDVRRRDADRDERERSERDHGKSRPTHWCPFRSGDP